jgi:TonB-dependent starch-binding outer membrane protein SusC
MKKIGIFGRVRENPPLTKWIRMMKLTCLLLTIALVQVSAETYSQTKKLTLNLKDAPLAVLFEEIEKTSEFNFFYDSSGLDLSQKVTVTVEDSNIETVLDMLFSDSDISYEIFNRYIILKSKERKSLRERLFAQQRAVSGKITDSDSQPLPGVTVVVKGTTQGTVTNADGNYSLTNIPEDATLVFSFVGMRTQEVFVGNQTTIDVEMVVDAIGIEEVVAIGYGTMKKVELTSSVSSVKADDFIKGSVTDAAQLLKGKVAGLSIIEPDANPTSTSQIYLRGITTLRSGSQPLVIVDGIPSSISLVAPEDIESIDILKDGSAAAIYGTRGSNGVILITTTKVKRDMPLSIEVNSYATVQTINKRLDFMNASQFREKVIGGGFLPATEDYGSNTDWLGEILRTPLSQSHNISFRGGTENSNYIINLNYKDTQGIIKRTNDNEFKTRIEANHAMFNNKLKMNASILSRQQKAFSGWNNGIYQMALIYNPTDQIKDENGNWTEHPEVYLYDNPVSMLYETEGDAQRTSIRTAGFVSFLPIPSLTFNLTASNFVSDYLNGYSQSKQHRSNIRNSLNGFASRNTNKEINNLLQLTGQYVLSVKDHNATFLGGYSWEESNYESFFANNWDFPSDLYTYNNLGAGQALLRGETSVSSYKSMARLISFFARVNYNYKSRYMLTASLRHEGSSKFGTNHQWGNFPALSAGWNIKNEEFMQDIIFFSSLKVRAGWGITGTVPNDSYVSISRLSTSDSFLFDGTWTPTILPSTNANPDLKWEKKKEFNLGLDIGVLKERITLTVDAYKRTTVDLLWNYNVPKPPYLYPNVIANAGSIENVGIEVNLSSMIVNTENIRWNSRINFSTNRNKILSLENELFQLSTGYIETGSAGEPIQQNTHRLEEGGKVGNFYGFHTIDIDEEGKWIIEGANGEPKSIFDQVADDKKIIGNGIPKFFISWDNQIQYKNFDLNVTMNGALGFDILNAPAMAYSFPMWLARGNVLNRAFDDKIFGKRTISADQDLQYVSYFIEKGDYLKLSNVTLGYNFEKFNSNISNLKLYFSGSNLFTFTKYSGIDPEVNVLGLYPGIDDRQRYPSARSFTLGLSITF